MMRFFLRPALTVYLTVRALISPVAFGVAALAFDKLGRVLLVRHTYQPGWMLPGGGVGRGEVAAEAVMRELAEEVGLRSAREPEFVALYVRKVGWVTNHIALYRVSDVDLA